MLLTKLQVNRSTGSGEEYFRRFFTIYGRGGHPGHVTSLMLTNFHFLVHFHFTRKNIVFKDTADS